MNIAEIVMVNGNGTHYNENDINVNGNNKNGHAMQWECKQ